MSNVKRDESEIDTTSPGQDESNNAEALVPEVVDSPNQKKKKPTRSTGKRTGRPVANADLERPVVINFIAHLIKKRTPDREIARLVNCKWSTFCHWKKRHEELWAGLADASEELENVKRSLYERCTGTWVERPIYDKVTGRIKGTKFQYYPPSDSSIQYYLNNRDPANWKSKVEHNHAIEELPLAVNFVRASDSKKKKEVKAITDDFGNAIIIDDDGNQGNS